MSTSTKRQDYITWDEYFMGVAMLSGMRSKDPNTQVGACIVSPEHKILSMGYNGFPLGCSDDEFTWSREGEDNKYYYSTHSELNAWLFFLNTCMLSFFNSTAYSPFSDPLSAFPSRKTTGFFWGSVFMTIHG